ncbi:MAG: hypothetical protein ABIJ04_11420 [Bacteroidota bacterium]
METSRTKPGKPNKILLCIERIATWAKESNLSPAFMKRCSPSARTLSNYLDCNEIQAILFLIVCNLIFNRVRSSPLSAQLAVPRPSNFQF